MNDITQPDQLVSFESDVFDAIDRNYQKHGLRVEGNEIQRQ